MAGFRLIVDIGKKLTCGVVLVLYYLCCLLDGCSRYLVHWDIKAAMKESDVELIFKRPLRSIREPGHGSFPTMEQELFYKWDGVDILFQKDLKYTGTHSKSFSYLNNDQAVLFTADSRGNYIAVFDVQSGTLNEIDLSNKILVPSRELWGLRWSIVNERLFGTGVYDNKVYVVSAPMSRLLSR